MKPQIPELTLVCVDCAPKVHLAVRAIQKSLQEITPACSKLITDRKTHSPIGEKFETVIVPRIDSLEAYSRFMIRELHKYVQTSHALVIQADGFVLNGQAWTNEFLKYDYGGAPFQPSLTIGNGGFSLRSKRLLEVCARLPEGNDHPEDAAISIYFRTQLMSMGFKFMPIDAARRFSFEGRSWNTREWQGVPNKWEGQFGFHSFLSVLPSDKKPCKVFHHSGDAGDVIYSLPVMALLGGGALFLSPHNRHPHPMDTKWTRSGGLPDFVDNIRPLLEAQPYVDRCSYTHGTPYSTDFDLNAFRKSWSKRSDADFVSIFQLHQRQFGVAWPPDKPWLTVPNPVVIPGHDIVVSRSARYHNSKFPWSELVRKYGARMIFVGNESEASLFDGFGAPNIRIPWDETKDMLSLARIIAGAKVFVGNQSSPLAIAHGLCKNVIVETWPLNSNCELERDNAIYWKSGPLELPESWL